MLGFGALGQFALGQLPQTTTYQVVASAGSYASTGNAASFSNRLSATVGNNTLSGNVATFRIPFSLSTGANSLAGNAAVFQEKLSAAVGAYSVAGNSDVLPKGSYLVSGITFPLTASIATASSSYLTVGRDQVFRTGFATTCANYIVGGNAATFSLAPGVISSGAYTVTGLPVSLNLISSLGRGVYTSHGYDALDYGLWRPRPITNEIWINRTTPPTGVIFLHLGGVGFSALGQFALGQIGDVTQTWAPSPNARTNEVWTVISRPH